jgi:hypothetical protein
MVQQGFESVQQGLEMAQQGFESVQQGLEMVQQGPQMAQALQLGLCLRMHFHRPLLGWDQNLNNSTTRKTLKMLNSRLDKLRIFLSCILFVYNLSQFINTYPSHTHYI